MGETELIDIKDLDPGFKFEVANECGGEAILTCMSCSTCSAGCPVYDVNPDYNPRRIIRMVLLGNRAVLQSPFIWLCSSCFTCQERCPQEVRITHIMRALRNMAIQSGITPEPVTLQMNAILAFSRLYEIDDFDNKKRLKSSLPALITDTVEIQKMYDVLSERK